jgi:hypothetical protein
MAASPEDIDGYRSWVDRLSQATGLNLTLQADFPSELALLEAMHTGRVILAPLSSYAYAYGHMQGWLEPGKIGRASCRERV